MFGVEIEVSVRECVCEQVDVGTYIGRWRSLNFRTSATTIVICQLLAWSLALWLLTRTSADTDIGSISDVRPLIRRDVLNRFCLKSGFS